jgi:hypothetical protein
MILPMMKLADAAVVRRARHRGVLGAEVPRAGICEGVRGGRQCLLHWEKAPKFL